jgi:hypothetical protein
MRKARTAFSIAGFGLDQPHAELKGFGSLSLPGRVDDGLKLGSWATERNPRSRLRRRSCELGEGIRSGQSRLP